jgi:hypothetical protein
MLLAASPFLIAVVLIAALYPAADQYFCFRCSERRVDLFYGGHMARYCPTCLSERGSL